MTVVNKKTILLVPLESMFLSSDDAIVFEIDAIREQCKFFNKHGYRTLVATPDGQELLEPSRPRGEDDVNYPLPLEKLHDDDFNYIAAVYVITPYPIQMHDLEQVGHFSHLLMHCKKRNKVIAVHSKEANQILYPLFSDQFDSQIFTQGRFAHNYMGDKDFGRTLLDLITLQVM
jgi:hypothetical protein